MLGRLGAGAFVALTLTLPAAADEPVTTFTLDNGLNVVVIEDHRAPVVVQMVWYKAGAADEPPGKSGIAHFLEHLLFKATDDMAAGEEIDPDKEDVHDFALWKGAKPGEPTWPSPWEWKSTRWMRYSAPIRRPG